MLLAAAALCLVLPVILKELLLKPLKLLLLGDTPAGSIFQWTGSVLMIGGGYIIYVRIFEKRRPSEFLSGSCFMDGLVYFFCGVGSIAFISLILLLAGVLSFERVKPDLGENYMLILLFLLCFTEEILYRGILYRLIDKWYGTAPALLVSALLFSIGHFLNSGFNMLSFIEILFGGTAMGLLFSLKRSLWVPTGFHFGWNWAQTAAGFTLSGLNDFAGLRLVCGKLSGREILTGGRFGFENSIVTVLYTVLLAVWLGSKLFRKRAAGIN